MLRGSRPGERRGGRRRGTPNRRTILTDRILAIGLDDPAASQRAFLLKLLKDRKLQADIRIAVAPACFPAKRTSRAGRPRALAGSAQTPAVTARDWNPRAFEALFGVVQDATADPTARRKAAQKIGELLLPKVGKKPKVISDQYGFAIRPSLAGAYRDIRLELRALVNEPTRKIPAIAEMIKRLEARSTAILRRIEMPFPTKYGDKEAAKDLDRLIELSSLRGNGTALTEAQQVEEAHLWARYDVFRASPESIARRRREALEKVDRRFRIDRSDGDFHAPPLSRKERNELKLLRRLYPAEPSQNLSPFEDDGFETRRDHPFAHELPAPDGNFYPRHSKLRPAAPKEDAETAHLAPGEARIHELEERRAVGSQLTASEEKELRDLRECYPEFAAVADLMDLRYLYDRRREFEIARKAGLDFDAINEQADVCCLRLRDESKFVHEWQARRFLRDRRGKAAGAVGRKP